MKYEHWKKIDFKDSLVNCTEAYVFVKGNWTFSLRKIHNIFEIRPSWYLFNKEGEGIAVKVSSRKPITTPPFKWADTEISDYIEDNSNKN